MNNIFETATRGKFRFKHNGNITVEQLWELSKEELNEIYQKLNSQVKKEQGESLLTTRTSRDVVLETKIEIVKHIFATKAAEQEAKVKAKVEADRKDRIKAIIERKENEALENMEIEELEKML